MCWHTNRVFFACIVYRHGDFLELVFFLLSTFSVKVVFAFYNLKCQPTVTHWPRLITPRFSHIQPNLDNYHF
jgi:hypothetical protein